ncbi:MAG: 2-dehydro-3-deoxygalactonokinase [Granulosicoccus sp.]
MNLVASDPVLIGVDWGTSSLRAYLISAQGDVLDRVVVAEGIMHVADGKFECVLQRLIEPWISEYSVPVIASGMITSRNGWLETAYLPVPSGAKELAEALVPVPTAKGLVLSFVTGLTTNHSGPPDVMRGEETQIVGAVEAGLDECVFVMPGTHSKWVSVRGSCIVSFETFMSGEIYAALRSHTILGALMNDSPFNEEGFREGVAAGLDAGAKLLHTLFHVRTMPLLGKISEDKVADFLSGMLIGAEINGATEQTLIDMPVVIVGRDDLADRYAIALQVSGKQSACAPDDIVARGHFSIAASAGLLS